MDERENLLEHLAEVRAELDLLRRSGTYNEYLCAEETTDERTLIAWLPQLADPASVADGAIIVQSTQDAAAAMEAAREIRHTQ